MDIHQMLIILASVALLFAVYFSFKLSKETKHELYWILLSAGLFIFAVHHWSMMLTGIISEKIQLYLEQLTSIIGASLMAYATFGLYKSLKIVKEKTK
ncbi:MAG: hypothetical protein MAG795_00269 [Candidatus Woesearchaeota archaeon]|nr:hypothetical protein [Candidatus Woesearchaeota archaeon]